MSEPAPVLAPSDAELLEATRSGDAAAFGALYERHLAAAQSLARQLVRGASDADDVVAETFAKVLDLLRRGGGPEDGFRPYLLTAVRRSAYDRYRGERRLVTTEAIEELDPGRPFTDPAVEGLERSLVARAFRSLPERWQAVLWHTEIEGAKPADVAPLLGLTANGVAALSYRAREGLRQGYLQMHLSEVTRGNCRPTLEKLGAYVRNGLSKRDTEAVEAHLEGCEDCRAVYAELTDVNSSLRGIIAPIFLGPAAAAYLASGKDGAGWLVASAHRIRHAPKPVQAAAGGGLAAAAAVAAVVSLTLTGQNGSGAQHAAAARPGQTAPAAPRPGAPRHPAPAQQPPGAAAQPSAGSSPAAQAGAGNGTGSVGSVPSGAPAPLAAGGGAPGGSGSGGTGGGSGSGSGSGSGGGGGGGAPPPPPPPSPPPAPSGLNLSAGASASVACAGLGVSASPGGVGVSAGLGSDLLQGSGTCPPPGATVSGRL